jgi:hypothetical protein
LAAIERALRRKVVCVAIQAQAGYSGTPLWKKLGFKEGMKVYALGSPGHYAALLADCPFLLNLAKKPAGADALHLFIKAPGDEQQITAFAEYLPPATMLWVSWPKMTSPLSQGLREDDIRKAALACGLVDVKVCAVDADWSGLKLMRRASSAQREAHAARQQARLSPSSR